MINAIQNKVIIRQHIKAVTKTASGLYLPEKTKQKRPGKGEVLSVGELVIVVKVGDKVLHSRWEGAEIKDDENPNGEPLLVLKDTDLLAKLEDYDL